MRQPDAEREPAVRGDLCRQRLLGKHLRVARIRRNDRRPEPDPVDFVAKKMKRGEGPIELRLEPNPDILKEVGVNKNGKMLVGFAAETEELIANAEKKLREKNLDMVVANNVTEEGAGFDVDTNVATIVDRSGTVRSLPLMSKDELAEQILDHLLALKTKR